MDFNQIQELIRLVTKNKLSTFYLQEGDFKIIIRNQPTHQTENTVPQVIYSAQAPVVAIPPASTPAPAPAPAPDLQGEKPAVEEQKPQAANVVPVKSPMVGTFYRSPSPDKPPFVKIGDEIEVGATVCIIEAMKLFNEIESEVKGKIVKVLVEDATPVEYDQPLFLVEPA